jgi:hypothetical protein
MANTTVPIDAGSIVYSIFSSGSVLSNVVISLLIAILLGILFIMLGSSLVLFNSKKKKSLLSLFYKKRAVKEHIQQKLNVKYVHNTATSTPLTEISVSQQDVASNLESSSEPAGLTQSNDASNAHNTSSGASGPSSIVTSNSTFLDEDRFVDNFPYLSLHFATRLSKYSVPRFFQLIIFYLWEVFINSFIPRSRTRYHKRNVKHYGRDIAVYLYFQQIMVIIFFIMSVIALATLLPIHIILGNTSSGVQTITSSHADTTSAFTPVVGPEYYFTLTSINMVIGSPALLASHTVLAGVFVLLLIASLVIFARSEIVNKFNFAEHDQDLSVSDVHLVHDGRQLDDQNNYLNTFDNSKRRAMMATTISSEGRSFIASPYTAEISGLPVSLTDPKLLLRMIQSVAPSLREIVKATIVYDLSQLDEFQANLRTAENDLEHLEHALDRSNGRLNSSADGDCDMSCLGHNSDFDTSVTIQNIKKCRERIDELKKDIYCWNKSFRDTVGRETKNDESSALEKRYNIEGTGFAYVIFHSTEACDKFIKNCREYGMEDWTKSENNEKTKKKKFSCKVKWIHHEPQDIRWSNLYRYNKLKGTEKQQNWGQRLLLVVSLLIIALVWFAPLSLASLLQPILIDGQFVTSGAAFTVLNYGPLGDFIFFYVPSLLAFIASVTLIPRLIKTETRLSLRSITFSEVDRSFMMKLFFYLSLVLLAIPTVFYLCLDWISQAIMQLGSGSVLQLQFLPVNGAFFVNLVLHFAIFKNSIDWLQPQTVLKYLFRMKWTQPLCYVRPGVLKSARERLECAEMVELNVNSEYAYMLVVMVISLTYGLLSPLVLPAAFCYFFFKHLIDRMLVATAEPHHDNNS